MTHKDIFLKEFSKYKKSDIRTLLLITIVLNFIMLITDYFVSGSDFWYYFIDRFVVNCSISFFLFIFYDNKLIKKYFVYLGIAIYLITGYGQILLLLANSNVYYFATLFLLILLGLPIFFVAYRGIFMFNMTFVVLLAVVQYFNYPDDLLSIIISVGMLLGFVLAVFLISYLLHKNMHSIFCESEQIEKDNTHLKESVDKSVGEIQKLNHDSIYSLAIIAESHDDFTGGHLERVGTLSKKLAHLLPNDSFIDCGMDKKELLDNIELASTLHDIGKIDIPVKILKKNGKLTPEERTIIETHSIKGYQILANIAELHHNNKTILLAKDIAKYHHENWDGSGYPEGLKGTNIPLSARIVGITDFYDALTQDRPYRKAVDKKIVKQMMIDRSAIKFDPKILDIFITSVGW